MPSNGSYSPVGLVVGVLDVHAGDVVGQQHDFVGVQFVGDTCAAGRVLGIAPHQVDDEVAGADEGVEDVDALGRRATCRTRFSGFPPRWRP